MQLTIRLPKSLAYVAAALLLSACGPQAETEEQTQQSESPTEADEAKTQADSAVLRMKREEEAARDEARTDSPSPDMESQ